ncbi:HlyU family transcriptional regulator [Kaistia sp. MMO-174]|uniref:HlyU family transcriptional regulator n=1 Tax=Kaistia sp. MMO-174 TaxID=3081256 RepID=UPI001AC5FF5E|nr:hypothetical protein [Hyphomicrobiales bacterium]
MSFLKKLFGGGGGGPSPAEAKGEATEYKGYNIRPAPYSEGGQYKTAGYIEKTIDGVEKSYRFVRVDSHTSRDAAADFAVIKGKQIIDEQGDRIFDAS